MMALTGHVATTVPPVGDDTHTVEYSDGELATDALTDADRVALPVRDATKPPETDADADAERDAEPVPDTMDLLAERDADDDAVVDAMKPPVLDADALAERVALAARDADTDADAVTLKPRVGDTDGDRVGDTSVHCTYSRKLVTPAQPPPADVASAPLGVMEHEFCPKHVALTTASLVAAPGHEPTANGPDGHDPVGLP